MQCFSGFWGGGGVAAYSASSDRLLYLPIMVTLALCPLNYLSCSHSGTKACIIRFLLDECLAFLASRSNPTIQLDSLCST